MSFKPTCLKSSYHPAMNSDQFRCLCNAGLFMEYNDFLR